MAKSKNDNDILFAMRYRLLPRIEKVMDNFASLMEKEANRPHSSEDEFTLKLKSLTQLDERVQELLACEDAERQARLRDEIRMLREIASRY